MKSQRKPRRYGATVQMLGSGQLDAGFAALAGFFAGALAVRYLSPEELGVYSLLFLAFGVVTQIPTQLILSPAEVLIAHSPMSVRLGSMKWSLPRGFVVSGASCLMVAAGPLPLIGEVDLQRLLPMIITGATFTLVSPLQDHVRRVMHTAERSGLASMISLVNLGVTVAAGFALLQLGPLWAPFGSMTVGNIVSLLAAVLVIRRRPMGQPPSTRDLTSIGRYLLLVGLANSGGGYLSATIVGWIAGPAALGFLEAARLVARPAQVSATGLNSALGPRIMVASANSDEQRISRLSRIFYLSVAAVGLCYTLIVATPIGWDLPRSLFPTAYEVGGLLAATLIAQTMTSFTRPMQAQLLGLRGETSLALIEFQSQVSGLAATMSALWVGAFAYPIADSVGAGLKMTLYARRLRRPQSLPMDTREDG